MKYFLCLLLLSFAAKGHSDEGFTYRQLAWEDFRGEVPRNEPDVAARSTVRFQLETTIVGIHCQFRVKATFLPHDSFVRIRKAHVLDHEQTHFKIAQIVSLSCQQDLASLQGRDTSGIDYANQLFQVWSIRRDSINKRFDLETDHGLEENEEMRWEAQISRELLILDVASQKSHGGNR